MRPEPAAREHVDRFSAIHDGIVVTLGLPTHPTSHADEDRLHLKNRITQADHMLEDAGWRSRDREERLAAARSLLTDAEFWEHQGHGLLVFVGEDGSCTPVALRRSIPPFTVVAASHHLRHLLADLSVPRRPVLVVTLGSVRLYEADPHGVRALEADLPDSYEDVNWFMDREAQLQQHAGARSGGRAIRHGHAPQDRNLEDVRRFLRAIDDALDLDPDVEVVVVGDDRLVAEFAHVSSRRVTSPRHSGIEDPDDRAVVARIVSPVIDDIVAARSGRAADAAEQIIGRGDAVTDPAEALRLAVAGLLAEVVVHVDAEPRWAQVSVETLEVTDSDGVTVGDVDLIDRLIAHASRTGAAVRLAGEALSGGDVVVRPRAPAAEEAVSTS